MDFGLDKKHEMARTLFKEFAENEVKPLAQEVDETEVFPRATVEKMAKYGFLGIPVPKEYEGQGCDPLTYVMCVEELAKVCATTSVIVSAHTSLCIDPILTYGTPEQKAKYVPDLASGRKLGKRRRRLYRKPDPAPAESWRSGIVCSSGEYTAQLGIYNQK